jgi:hypothetical protein
MGAIPSALNQITIRDRTLLLTETGGGVAIHLTKTVTDLEHGRPAIPRHVWAIHQPAPDASLADHELSEPRWSPRTLCGIRWDTMAGVDPDAPIGAHTRRPETPTCRSCLAHIDRWFPSPAVDHRVGLLATLIGDAVHSHGTAEVVGVPGDQMTALRVAARQQLKQRFGIAAKTFVIEDRLIVAGDHSTDQRLQQLATQFFQAFDTANTDPHVDDSEWRFHWQT